MILNCAQGTHAYSQSPPEWTIDSVGYQTEVNDIQGSVSGSGVVFLHAVRRLECIWNSLSAVAKSLEALSSECD